MELDLNILRPQERVSLQLRLLYEQAGFRQYHMGRFEEYCLLYTSGVIHLNEVGDKAGGDDDGLDDLRQLRRDLMSLAVRHGLLAPAEDGLSLIHILWGIPPRFL